MLLKENPTRFPYSDTDAKARDLVVREDANMAELAQRLDVRVAQFAGFVRVARLARLPPIGPFRGVDFVCHLFDTTAFWAAPFHWELSSNTGKYNEERPAVQLLPQCL
jgi:hypothetical protein